MTMLAGLFAAIGLWVWPSANWVLARVVERVRPERRARWLGVSAPSPDPFDIAATYDLFAVCLRAGLPVSAAADVASAHAPPVVGEPLARAADLLALGADGQTAWRCDDGDESFAELAALARRASRAGSSLADGVADLATATRRRAADAAVEAAEKAGVKLSGPLGLCFLPAFVCLGIVPVVIGLAAGMLTSV